MLFPIFVQAATALTNGLRTKVTLKSGVVQSFSLPVVQRATFRYYFETTNEATIYICSQGDEAFCITQKKYLRSTGGNTTNTSMLEVDQGLYKLETVYLLVKSLSDQTVYITAHFAVEMQEFSFFTSSAALPAVFQDTKRTFARFSGSKDVVELKGTIAQQTVLDVKFYCFDGKNQNIKTTTITIDQEYHEIVGTDVITPQCAAGWLYVTFNTAVDYTFGFQSTVQNLQLNQRLTNSNHFPLVEQMMYCQLLINPDDFKDKDLTITAFTDTPTEFDNVKVYVSTQNFFGIEYLENGKSQEELQYSSYLSQITVNANISDKTKFSKCVDNLCTVFITLSYITDPYLLSKSGYFYQPQPLHILTLTNAVIFNQLPAATTIKLNEQNNFRQTTVVNELLQAEGVVSGYKNQGYVFYVEKTPGKEEKLANSIVNLENLAGANGVSFHIVDETSQAIITNQINSMFYIPGGMYFINTMSEEAFDGVIGSHSTYNIDETQTLNMKETTTGSSFYFHANVGSFKKYQFCAKVGAKSTATFTLMASNSHYSPTPDFHDFMSGEIIQDELSKYFCVTGETDGNDIAYFSLQATADSTGATLSFGVPFHFIKSVPVDTQTHFYADSAQFVYQRLLPPYYASNKDSFLEHMCYFEMNLKDALTQDVILTITEPVQKFTITKQTLKAGSTYFGQKLLLPVDRQLLFKIEAPVAAAIRGHTFFSYVYDEPQASIVPVKLAVNPVIFHVNVQEFESPIITITSKNVDLTLLQAYICKDQPKLNAQDNYAHECFTYTFTKMNYETLIFPSDVDLTQSVTKPKYQQLQVGSYYVSLLPKADLISQGVIEFEYSVANLLKNGVWSAVRLYPDSLLSTLGYRTETFFVFDGIFKVSPLYAYQFVFDLKVKARKICITVDEPLTANVITSDTSKCIAYKADSSFITGKIEKQAFSQMTQYTRLYLNIFGDYGLFQVQQVYFAAFQIATSTMSELTLKLKSGTNRASEDISLVTMEMDSTKFEVSNALSTDIKDYQKALENGTSNKTRLYVSDEIEFDPISSTIDETNAIQIVTRVNPDKQLRTYYVKVELKELIVDEVQYKLKMQGDDKITQQKLEFQKTYKWVNVKPGTVSQMYFNAAHTPMTINVQVCQAKMGSTIETYTSPFIIAPTANTYADNLTHKIDNVQINLPGHAHDQNIYQNLNFFIGVNYSQAVSSYEVIPEVGNSQPAIPLAQEVYVDRYSKSNNFLIKFRPSSISTFLKYDGFLSMGLPPQPKTIKYTIFAYEADQAKDTDIISTLCGLKLAAKEIEGYSLTTDGTSTNKQEKFEFKFDGVTKNTQFILVAQNSAANTFSVYKPVQHKDSNNKTVNTTALVCGIVFGVLGLVLLALLILWIVRVQKKKNQIYTGISP
ncbi:Conserved_hypothetical protein [Hexamita inflata]|uniref:Uncharacterized protein n=1 Tax=Hexamita inflata TaxID=28002 RepID=A0ABP1GZL8_9EUKA